MKVLYKILQKLTYNIHTQYESKDFLLTKFLLSWQQKKKKKKKKKKNKKKKKKKKIKKIKHNGKLP